ncbi:MAG: hypothetical protein IJ419_01190 [Agathobacter sp.]|nr:hypothetical protein [Agathobacter sp.]
MGLDTFVFAIRKPSDDEMKWVKENDLATVKETGKYLILSKKRVDKDPELYADMQPYWAIATTTETQFDWMKCLADHGVSCEDDLAFSGRTPKGVSFGFASGAEITMTMEEYESYAITDISEVYIIAKDDIARLRNNWDTLEAISDMRTQRYITQHINNGTYEELKDAYTQGIHNCGYYVVDDEEKELLKKDIEDDSMMDKNTVGFYAWW